jgi:hypothetical protein
MLVVGIKLLHWILAKMASGVTSDARSHPCSRSGNPCAIISCGIHGHFIEIARYLFFSLGLFRAGGVKLLSHGV